MQHALDGVGTVCDRRRLGEPLAPGQIVLIATAGNEGLDLCRLAVLHVRSAVEAGIGQQGVGGAEGCSIIGATCRASAGVSISRVATMSIESVSTAAWTL